MCVYVCVCVCMFMCVVLCVAKRLCTTTPSSGQVINLFGISSLKYTVVFTEHEVKFYNCIHVQKK